MTDHSPVQALIAAVKARQYIFTPNDRMKIEEALESIEGEVADNDGLSGMYEPWAKIIEIILTSDQNDWSIGRIDEPVDAKYEPEYGAMLNALRWKD